MHSKLVWLVVLAHDWSLRHGVVCSFCLTTSPLAMLWHVTLVSPGSLFSHWVFNTVFLAKPSFISCSTCSYVYNPANSLQFSRTGFTHKLSQPQFWVSDYLGPEADYDYLYAFMLILKYKLKTVLIPCLLKVTTSPEGMHFRCPENKAFLCVKLWLPRCLAEGEPSLLRLKDNIWLSHHAKSILAHYLP